MLEKEQGDKFFIEELKIIQDIIKRMALNSFMIKGWANGRIDLKGKNPFDIFTFKHNDNIVTIATYDWVYDDGYNNLGTWVEKAAKQVGR